eukprot:105461-Hanusia_phi.AAC.1
MCWRERTVERLQPCGASPWWKSQIRAESYAIRHEKLVFRAALHLSMYCCKVSLARSLVLHVYN